MLRFRAGFADHVHSTAKAAGCPLAASRLLGSVMLATAALSASAVQADPGGRPLYGPWKSNEGGEYPRVIRLQQAGGANGTLLATFEHTFRDGTPGYLVIRRSADEGVSWSTAAIVPEPNRWPTMWQPSLLELPRRIGNWPAGTILLAENSSTKIDTRIYLFSSADHGTTWRREAAVVSGNGPKAGVWEPWLMIDGGGRLDMFFSDERNGGRYSQMLGGFVFDERANAFDTSREVPLVASDVRTDRPGMVTVARLPNGRFIAAYEVCTSLRAGHCPVYVKTSDDGLNWPRGIGQSIATRDGDIPSNNPYIVWSPGGGPMGQLTLTSANTGDAPSSMMLVNQDPGFRANAWGVVPRPYFPPQGKQYSVSLLPSPDGRLMRLTGEQRPFVRTAVSSSGVLPYADTFAQGSDYGWLDYGGTWTVATEAGQGVYSDSGGPGSKAIAGSSLWRDYTLTSDVRVNGAGQAGVLVRASKATVGMDALNGYYFAINPSNGSFFGGREDGGWTRLGGSTVRGLAPGRWYTITVSARGPQFEAVLTDRESGGFLGRLDIEDGRFPMGAIGLRDVDTAASWRRVRVDMGASKPFRIGQPMRPIQ